MRKIWIVFTLLMLFVGCSSKSVSDEGAVENYQPEIDYANKGNSGIMALDMGERKQIVNATLTLDTEQFEETIQGIQDIVKEQGGYIQSSNLNHYENQKRYAEYVVRIPFESLDLVMKLISEKGLVKNQSQFINDITDSYRDVERHLEILDTEYQKLLGLLEKAEDISTVLMIEQRLSDLMYQMESYKNQQNNYDLLMKYSTLNVFVYEKEAVVMSNNSIWNQIQITFQASINTILMSIQWLIVMLAGNIIYVILFGLLMMGGYKLIRKHLKK